MRKRMGNKKEKRGWEGGRKNERNRGKEREGEGEQFNYYQTYITFSLYKYIYIIDIIASI